MLDFYILENKQIKKVEALEWAEWLEISKNRISSYEDALKGHEKAKKLVMKTEI